ncbi:neuropeptide Y receptor type 1-like [Ptychodera flava]|uniref:neuropeptide Y receptor type 1-like n=1 Tax=Ptychodera flava TaxID=63121 RepID=UPI003969FC32
MTSPSPTITQLTPTPSTEIDDYIDDANIRYVLPTIDDSVVKILTVIFSVGVALSVVENIVVILVLTHAKKGKTSFYLLIFNLAVSDWTLSLLCLPFLFTSTVMGEWVFGFAMCKLVSYLHTASEIVSIFTLVAICIERYRAIMYPLPTQAKKRHRIIAIILIWIAALIICCPYPILNQLDYYPLVENRTAALCTNSWPMVGAIYGRKVYMWIVFLLMYVGPLLILGICYLRTVAKLRLYRLPRSADNRMEARSKRKAITSILFAVIMFAICWLPIHLFRMVVLTHRTEFLDTHPMAVNIIKACGYIWLIISDAVFNPIIYAFISKNFRRDFYRICLSCRRLIKRRDREPAVDSQNREGRRRSTDALSANKT